MLEQGEGGLMAQQLAWEGGRAQREAERREECEARELAKRDVLAR
jgi:hypothetical protein